MLQARLDLTALILLGVAVVLVVLPYVMAALTRVAGERAARAAHTAGT
jgi:hypothetical protein